MASTTVTIDKNYFETLLRRAEFDVSSDASTASTVTISKAEHETLLRVTQDHYLLLRALFRGGITQETINVLLESEKYAQDATTFKLFNQSNDGAGAIPKFMFPEAAPVTLRAPVIRPLIDTRFLYPAATPHRPDTPEFSSRSLSSNDAGKSNQAPPSRAEFTSQPSAVPGSDQRTILFTNLPDRTTLKDLVSVIRGGRLLEIHFRNDRCATVTFIEGAHEFLTYTRRNDVYLHNKRLEVGWNDRQFTIHANLANKLATGVSRNFVLRGAQDKLTEEGIRIDMEHIHNLVIIDVAFRGGDAYISTNSVQGALFAKTCMMSRKEYKGLKFEWYADQCVEALPKVEPVAKYWKATPAPSRYSTPVFNRFEALNTEWTEADSSVRDEDDEMRDELQGFGVNLNWACLN